MVTGKEEKRVMHERRGSEKKGVEENQRALALAAFSHPRRVDPYFSMKGARRSW